MIKVFCSIISLLIVVSACSEKPKPNFTAVDDLRTELNCYGATHMKTPNIDCVAQAGVLFERVYCQQAVCAPSRNSLLTGQRSSKG